METCFRRPLGRFFCQGGFTLVELLVVMALLVLLITVAVPGYSRLVHKERSEAALHSFAGMLKFARQYALSQHQPVSLCARSAQGLCRNDGDSWQQGMLIYLDHSASGNYQPDKDELLRDLSLTQSPHITSNRSQVIFFSANGMGNGAAGRFCFGQPVSHSLVISFTGRMRTEHHHDCPDGPNCPSC